MVILFVDMLGVRSRWHKGGREAAEAAFQSFRSLVASSLKGITEADVPSGIVETDAAVLICSSVKVALNLGKRLYRAAFAQSTKNPDTRFWLRGAIVPRTSDKPLRKSTSFAGTIKQVEIMLYDSELLDAIQVEKSGIKGMRLLVDKDLIVPDINREFAVKIGELNFIPLKRLRNSTYPKKIAEGYLDYFWMASEDQEESIRFDRLMALRLRHAAHDPDEFAQAAATQVLFHEYAAIMGSIRTRLEFEGYKRKAKAGGSLQESVTLTDGTRVLKGDTLFEGRELGKIVAIHPNSIHLSTMDGKTHRKVQKTSQIFQRLKKIA